MTKYATCVDHLARILNFLLYLAKEQQEKKAIYIP
jgi:hypothetical protein